MCFDWGIVISRSRLAVVVVLFSNETTWGARASPFHRLYYFFVVGGRTLWSCGDGSEMEICLCFLDRPVLLLSRYTQAGHEPRLSSAQTHRTLQDLGPCMVSRGHGLYTQHLLWVLRGRLKNSRSPRPLLLHSHWALGLQTLAHTDRHTHTLSHTFIHTHTHTHTHTQIFIHIRTHRFIPTNLYKLKPEHTQ